MREFNKWIEAKGDSTLRLNYDLNEDSIVFDVGGYRGEWAEKIYNKYNCNIYIFEPVKSFYNLIDNKFKNNNKVKVFNFGLSNEDSVSKIYLNGDSSSEHQKSGKEEKIRLININQFLENEKIENIHLIKINIEGAEYDFLDFLNRNNLVNIINDIQVQFHSFFENAVKRRENIRKELNKTHEQTYCFDFIWENWSKK